MKGKRRIIALIFGFIECIVFAGIVHGWSSLVVVLKADGVFSHLCHVDDNTSQIPTPVTLFVNLTTSRDMQDLPLQNADSQSRKMVTDIGQVHSDSVTENGAHETEKSEQIITCPEGARILNLVYILSTTVMMVTNALQGKVFDMFGLRILRLGATVLFIPGSLMVALADADNPWMIFPGFIMLSLSGMSVIMSNVHISLLAGHRKSTVTALYSGAVDCGVWVFMVVKALWESGVSRKVSLGVLTAMWLLVVIDTFVLVPRFKIDWEEHKLRFGIEVSTNIHRDVLTLRECLCSPVYITHCVWMCLMYTRVLSFVGSFEAWVGEMTDNNPDKVQSMTSIFSLVMFGGVLFTPLVGLSMDWCQKRLFSTVNNMTRNAFAAMPVLFIHGAIAALFSICILIKGEFFVYVSFFFFAAFKSGLFAIFYSYSNLVIPPDHYGVLLGMSTLFAGCAGLMQFPLVVWAQKSPLGFLPMNIFLLSLTVLALGHPICICIMNRSERPASNQSTASSKMLPKEKGKSESGDIYNTTEVTSF